MCRRSVSSLSGLWRRKSGAAAARLLLLKARPVYGLTPVRGFAALGVLAALAVVALTARPMPARARSNTSCGSAYRPLRTLSDPQRNLVKLSPKDTTLAAIAQLPRPAVTPTTRNTAFERQVWRVATQIVASKLEGDGDIELLLYDATGYGIAAMPAAKCVPMKARDRKAIINVRQQFVSACGQPTNAWKPLGAVVNISGVGFWDKPHIEAKQHAPNFAELEPVTGLSIVAGCS